MATLRSLHWFSPVHSPMFILLRASTSSRLKLSRLSTYTRRAYSRTMQSDSITKSRPALRVLIGLRELLSTLRVYVTCLLRCTAVRYGGMLLSSAVLSNVSSSASGPEAIFNSPGTLIVDGELIDSVRVLERELNAVQLQPDVNVASSSTQPPASNVNTSSEASNTSSVSQVSNAQSGAANAAGKDDPHAADITLSSSGAPDSPVSQATQPATQNTNLTKPGAQSVPLEPPSLAKSTDAVQAAKPQTQQAASPSHDPSARGAAHSSAPAPPSQPTVDMARAGTSQLSGSNSSQSSPSPTSAPTSSPAPSSAAAVTGRECGVGICAGAGIGEWHPVIDEPDFKVWKRPVPHSQLFEYKGSRLIFFFRVM